MASPASSSMIMLIIASFMFISSLAQSTCTNIQSIYNFGDSISDTGNHIRLNPTIHASRWPYGESFPRGPTGRCSNGMLIIDHLTASLDLPQLNPYLDHTASFTNGVNFAVSGSTALNTSFFEQRGLHDVPATNSPLSRQLEWFRTHLSYTCGTPEACAERLRNSLIMMGEIGGNDYNYFFFGGRSIQEIRTMVPYVVGAIVHAIREVIRLGAMRIVVPGNFPVGCFPIYLTQFGGPNVYYDDKGCIGYLNSFALFHNRRLQDALAQLRAEFPRVTILYADYYSAFQAVLRDGRWSGVNPSSALKACCGIEGGFYNYDGGRPCGSLGMYVCPDPDSYISWDGVHLTQNAYRHMSEILIRYILPMTQCLH